MDHAKQGTPGSSFYKLLDGLGSSLRWPFVVISYEIMLPGRKSCPGPEIGRILIGNTPASGLRPTEDGPAARFGNSPDWNPSDTRPEPPSPAQKHYSIQVHGWWYDLLSQW